MHAAELAAYDESKTVAAMVQLAVQIGRQDAGQHPGAHRLRAGRGGGRGAGRRQAVEIYRRYGHCEGDPGQEPAGQPDFEAQGLKNIEKQQNVKLTLDIFALTA